MEKPICNYCGEYSSCTCVYETCSLCKNSYSNYDCNDNHQMYEYRGALGCSRCIEEVRIKRDYQRQEVIEMTEKSIKSQLDGEWSNGGYKYMKTSLGGKPSAKIKEPLILKEYEKR